MRQQEYIVSPKWSSRFFKWFCREEFYEDIKGDLDEEFNLLLDDHFPLWKARWWYRWQIIRLFRPSMIKKNSIQKLIERQTIMFRNNLKIGFRNLWKYKMGSLINISGLAIGIAAFVLISLFIKDELSYDQHHKNADEIYRVTVKNFVRDGSLSRHWAFASAGHASRLKEDYSFVTHAARFFPWAYPDLAYGDVKLAAQPVIFADNDVWDIFSFPFILGDKEEAFKDVFSIVLTESSAVRIFGNDWREQNILGEAVVLSRDGNEGPFKVSGVIEDVPEQQHFHFEYLAPMRFLETVMGEDEMNNVGGNYNWLTYIRVEPGTDIRAFEQESDQFFNKYIGKIFNLDASDFYAFHFQPIKSIHLHSNLEGEIEANGSIDQVYIFGIVGVLLLLVACINYMNLATSHYSRRTKEVGVRKVVGATKSTLIGQFLTESLLITVLATPIALILVHLGLPYVNEFVEKRLVFDLFANLKLLLALVVLALFTGAVAGFYPAIFLARINLLKSLKGESVMRSSRWNFRSWLVTFQYTVAIALIFSILVIQSQMGFIQNSDPGYQKEHILTFGLSRNIRNLEVFKNELAAIPEVKNVTMSSRIPTGRLLDNMGSMFFKGDSLVPTNFRLPYIRVDENFLDTYDIELIAGDRFQRGQDAYTDSIGYYLINRKAAEALGYKNPDEIIGTRLAYGPFNDDPMKAGRILGVVEDFHFESMHSPIVPMLMLKTNQNLREVSLQATGGNYHKLIEKVESVYATFDPETTAQIRFIDDLFDEQYRNEERMSKMIAVFTAIAIFIGCLGLIGMVGFIIETKTKEIGIRKVLGASVQNILVMISNHFFVLIIIAFGVALPVSYWLMSGWLDDFEYRTQISWWIVLLPLIIASAFTVLTLAYQSLRASLSNPVDALKDE